MFSELIRIFGYCIYGCLFAMVAPSMLEIRFGFRALRNLHASLMRIILRLLKLADNCSHHRLLFEFTSDSNGLR